MKKQRIEYYFYHLSCSKIGIKHRLKTKVQHFSQLSRSACSADAIYCSFGLTVKYKLPANSNVLFCFVDHQKCMRSKRWKQLFHWIYQWPRWKMLSWNWWLQCHHRKEELTNWFQKKNLQRFSAISFVVKFFKILSTTTYRA